MTSNLFFTGVFFEGAITEKRFHVQVPKLYLKSSYKELIFIRLNNNIVFKIVTITNTCIECSIQVR